jgi:DNA-binding NarL/FixJ family response regulator
MPAQPRTCSVHVTPREAEVLDLLSQGLNDKEIGLSLSLTTRTVKGHIAKAASKLRVRGDKTGHRILLARYWGYPLFRIGAGIESQGE